MMQLWSWGLTAIGVTGLYLVSSGRRWGWLINIGSQVLWLTYAIVTRQWGFIPAALAYGWVFTRNYRRVRPR